MTCFISNIAQSSNVNWYRNNKAITDDDERITITDNGFVYSIEIDDTVTSDSGEYGCNVSNSFIFDYVATDITVGSKRGLLVA